VVDGDAVSLQGGQQWFVSPESPFLETLTALTFLAGVTEKVQLGASVIVMPYRHPLFTARVATSIDTLSKGRLILGAGIGWMPEEFASLGVDFKSRAAMSEEQLQIFNLLWSEERPEFHGTHYDFNPMAVNAASTGRADLDRRSTPARGRRPYSLVLLLRESRPTSLRGASRRCGRWRSTLGVTPTRSSSAAAHRGDGRPVPQDGSLRGRAVDQAFQPWLAAGVEHMALQFIVGRWPERKEQIQRFGEEVIPALRK
jgi:alkanesulfonate monooxygenase SsuD/methylene tetrahydromethanopterin reductase-like flavin-dependent oxidoreductase (luciferase family)